VKKELEKIKEQIHSLTILSDKLKAKEDFQLAESIRLSEREKLVEDKESAVRRLAAEVNKWKK
jgi:hypothetical protein